MSRKLVAASVLLLILLVWARRSRMPVPPPPHTGQSETVPKLSRRDATVPFSHSSIQPAEPEKPLGARISKLLNDDGKSHLLRGVQLAEYLAQNHSNAFSLVAAFEA